ncbi:MAG: hypothetical protein LBI18_00105 [Planctomycetaceae bacterium]|jgi:hypothetical protein|nr:hypothetical protein [Planctomycetaceae bacterium]
MRTFFTKPILGIFLFLFLISSGIFGAEPSYWVDSVYQTNPIIVSETVPIRVSETAVSYDFPHEPQIIEQRILSTRIVSTSEPPKIKNLNEKPLLPLHQTAKKELPKTTESTENLTVISETSPETTREKPFPEITFPLLEDLQQKELQQTATQKNTTQTTPTQTTALKPPQPLPDKPNVEPQVPPMTPIILGQSSSTANNVEQELAEPLPTPRGLVDTSAIDPRLFGNTAENQEISEKNNPSTSTTENNSTTNSKNSSEENQTQNGKQTNRVNGILLLATIISIAMLIYAVVIAFDYHQRWIQSLTAQNNRFSGSSDSGFVGDDLDMDADFSENIPLYHGNSMSVGVPHFRSESSYY